MCGAQKAYPGMKLGIISVACGLLLLLDLSVEIVSTCAFAATKGASFKDSAIESVSSLEDQPAGAHASAQNNENTMQSNANGDPREPSFQEPQTGGAVSVETPPAVLQKTPGPLGNNPDEASKEGAVKPSGKSHSSPQSSGSEAPSPPDTSKDFQIGGGLKKNESQMKAPRGRRADKSPFKSGKHHSSSRQSSFGRKLAALDHSSDSEDSRLRSSGSKMSRQRKGGKRSRSQPTREEQLQVLRTVQLLNILIKQHKKQALEHAAPRGARINPTRMALSFEELLGKVHERSESPADEKAESGEEGLSWAAALILAIPPSLLAIILAHHIAKRQAGPMPAERRKELLASKRRFEEAGGEFKIDSDSDSSIADDFLRAEAEAAAYVEYQPKHSVRFAKPSRIPRASTAMNLPAYWASKGRHSEFYRKVREPFPSEFEDASGHVNRRKKHVAPFGYDGPAMPLSHGYAELDDLDYAWAAAEALEYQDEANFRMHGGV